jgi:RNA polymerase sigma factor (sigma-70 family)
VLTNDEVTELLTVTLPRLHRHLGTGSSAAFDVEDLVQDAMERALTLKQAGYEIAHLPGWVQVVVLNLRRDEWRRVQAEGRALDRLARERPALTVGASSPDVDDDLVDKIGDLPPRQRQIMTLHYYADVSVDSIAQRLGIDPGTVKSTLHRGRRALAALLRPALDREEKPMSPSALPDGHQLPGWIMAGSHSREYEHGIAEGESHDGKRAAFLRCVADQPGGFGTVMQMVDATNYRMARLRLRGFIRSDDAEGWAGLWMRVDEPSGNHSAFDNMVDRPIEGTTGWREHHVVLDVGEESAAIAFGILLTGSGEVHFADFHVEKVDDEVPLTGTSRPGQFPPCPNNLDFSAG